MEKITIFDIDDTLVYTSKNALKKSQIAAGQMGVNPPSEEDFFAVYGKYSFEECVNLLHPGVDVVRYKKMYDDTRRIIPYEPIDSPSSIIGKLMDSGLGVGVLTNGPEDKTFLKLDALHICEDIRKKMLFVLHSGNLKHKKPNPECFLQAFDIIRQKTNDINGVQIDYIGDCIDDYIAASRANIGFIGVLSGFTDKKSFIEAGAPSENLLNSIMDLPNYYKI